MKTNLSEHTQLHFKSILLYVCYMIYLFIIYPCVQTHFRQVQYTDFNSASLLIISILSILLFITVYLFTGGIIIMLLNKTKSLLIDFIFIDIPSILSLCIYFIYFFVPLPASPIRLLIESGRVYTSLGALYLSIEIYRYYKYFHQRTSV